MYQPRHFRIDDRARLHGVIRDHALATLVTVIDGALEANHLPVLLDAEAGPHGALRFHLARANPLASALDGAREALLVFQGEQAYVSPDWYASPHLVPTWNYAVVHAHGRPQPLDDAGLCALLDDLSASQEGRLDKRPWTTAKLPADVYARMRRAIAGYVLPIERLEGKWKMSQNRGVADRRGVIAALSALPGDQAAATADSMADLLDAEGGATAQP